MRHGNVVYEVSLGTFTQAAAIIASGECHRRYSASAANKSLKSRNNYHVLMGLGGQIKNRNPFVNDGQTQKSLISISYHYRVSSANAAMSVDGNVHRSVDEFEMGIKMYKLIS